MNSWKRSAPLLSQFPESQRIFLKETVSTGRKISGNRNWRTLERIRGGARRIFTRARRRGCWRADGKNGGSITLEDLRDYKAVERKPLEGNYKGYGVITSPPPSSGGVGVLQMLGMLNGPATKNTARGPRRLTTTWRKRCDGVSRTAISTWAIPTS